MDERFKEHGKAITILIVVIVILIALIGGASYLAYTVNEKTNSLIINNEKYQYEEELIKADLETYGHLSDTLIVEITKSIKQNSEEYKIPMGLLHAIFRVESDYKFWVTHLFLNKINDNAIGLGGIVWHYWGKRLKQNKIAFAKTDLYIPAINIRATAFVVRSILDTKKDFRDIGQLIESYYGVWDETYRTKMLMITSDLWMKRIIKEIRDNDDKQPTKTGLK